MLKSTNMLTVLHRVMYASVTSTFVLSCDIGGHFNMKDCCVSVIRISRDFAMNKYISMDFKHKIAKVTQVKIIIKGE